MSNNKQSGDLLINIDEASKITNYSVSTLYQKTSKNQIPYIKKTGEKSLWFNKEELLNYCKKPSQKKKNKARNEISIREVLTDAQLKWIGRVILEHWKTSPFLKPYFFPNVDSATIKQNQTIKTYTEEKQSSVELFIEQLEEKGGAWENVSIRRLQISIDVSDYMELKQQAKAMHKEEIENAYREGWMENIRCKHTPNRYYNETFGSSDSLNESRNFGNETQDVFQGD
jgi:predicted DNA-binding transcriptional regulator AlpA